jgi:hypothetical protein
VLGHNAFGKGREFLRVLDIEDHRAHAISARDRLLERRLAAPRDDDGVAEIVEAQRQLAADAGSVTGDEHRVSCRLHCSVSPCFQVPG